MNAVKQEEHISYLDYLRGIAIILVFLFHALGASYGIGHLNLNRWLGDFVFLLLLPAKLGWSGVAIFFVVSGFCIHLSHERSKNRSFKVFFARRFFRVYPPYFVTLIFFAFVFPLTKLTFHSLHDFAQLAVHVLLVHNFDARSSLEINRAYWSMAVEAQLYLLYPVLLWLTRRLGWNTALLLIASIEGAARAVCAWNGAMPGWFVQAPFMFWFSWSIGAFLANAYLKGQPLILRKCPLWLWPSVTVICYFIQPLSEFCFISAALFAANLIAYLLSTPRACPSDRRSFVLDWLLKHLRWTGLISYSVYLIHQPLQSLVPKFLARLFPGRALHPLIIFACCLMEWPVVLFLAYWFYRFVEKPSIGLGKWFVRTKLEAHRDRERQAGNLELHFKGGL